MRRGAVVIIEADGDERLILARRVNAALRGWTSRDTAASIIAGKKQINDFAAILRQRNLAVIQRRFGKIGRR